MFLNTIKGAGRPAGSAGDPTDPDFSSVVLLSGFEGSDASTSFDDESLSDHALTAVANAQIDTAEFKFGASSYLGDGSGDYIKVLDGPGSPSNRLTDFDFGTGDFTIESWVKTSVSPANAKHITSRGISTSANSSWFFYMASDGRLAFWCRGAIKVISTTLINNNAWRHVAVSRNGVKIRLFIGGSIENTVVDGSPFEITPGNEETWIGDNTAFGAGRSWDGWLDEMRVTIGVARYTAGFTPPVAAFPRS